MGGNAPNSQIQHRGSLTLNKASLHFDEPAMPTGRTSKLRARYETRGPQMNLRHATEKDIDALMSIRAAVAENRLTDPAKVGREKYVQFIKISTIWVFETDHGIDGFSACDPRNGSIWALFVAPDREGRGIGQQLIEKACRDLQRGGWSRATLCTEPGTRAEDFYAEDGWSKIGVCPDGDVMLERRLAL